MTDNQRLILSADDMWFYSLWLVTGKLRHCRYVTDYLKKVTVYSYRLLFTSEYPSDIYLTASCRYLYIKCRPTKILSCRA